MFHFIKEVLALPEFASWVALSAMAISGLSYIWTHKATQTSQLALEHAKSMDKKNEFLETEKNRYELLCAISNEKALLMDAYLELGALKADHDADNAIVKTMLQNFSQLFDYLPKVELSIAQLDQLYSQVVNTNPAFGSVYLLQMAAEQNRISKDTDYFKKCCDDCLATFKEKREMAIQYQHAATR